jgi:hypothetical protein
MVVTATRAIAAGEELLLSYGEHTLLCPACSSFCLCLAWDALPALLASCWLPTAAGRKAAGSNMPPLTCCCCRR